MYTQQSKIGPRAAKGQVVMLTIRHEATCGRANGYEECTCHPTVTRADDDTTQGLGLSNSTSHEVK
jgi:hypothetical protein